jgi:hypothetical protein
MSASDDELVGRMAKKHAVSPAAVQVVLAALRSGGGRMAQFSHDDFGGMSQWSPGMSMVGDMFNTQLKASWTRCAATSLPIWRRPRLPTLRDLPRTTSATVRCRDRQTGGRPDWASRPPSARRIISDTPFFPTLAGW